MDTQRYNENKFKNPPSEPKSLIEFKVNDSILGQNQKVPSYNQIWPAPYVPIQNPLPPEYPYVTGSNPYSYASGGSQHMYPWVFTPNNVPVIKNYNISLSNPAGDHVQISDIYEDMLPKSKFKNTSITLGERNVVYDYVRATLVSVNDGEDIDLTGRIRSEGGAGKKNLLSYLKLLELNPYHNNSRTPNPYVSLPDRMLLYRSCYPIRFDPNSHKVSCSRTSIGLNLRIYDMSIAELNASRMYEVLNQSKFDLWRELAFYELIREEILKKKQCPNFAMLYAYFISSRSGIDFNKIRLIKREHGVSTADIEQKQYQQIHDMIKAQEDKMIAEDKKALSMEMDKKEKDMTAREREMKRKEKDMNRTIHNAIGRYETLEKLPLVAINTREMTNGPINLAVPMTLLENDLQSLRSSINWNLKHKKEQGQMNNLKLNMSTGHVLLALTEAPHYNILQWAKKTYIAQHLGPIKKAVNTGYRDEKVWYSVIFQIMAGLHAMYKNNIAIRGMSITDNIFIKDLMTSNDQNAGYWKYIIDGYEYYVPNYGYLVMIDTNYKNITSDDRTVRDIRKVNDQFDISDMEYKIIGDIDPKYNERDSNNNLTDNAKKLKKQVKEEQFSATQSILNSNNFGQEFKRNGGVPPPSNIISLLNSISTLVQEKGSKSETRDGDLSNIIQKTMTKFLNNRIGTLLTTEEIKEGVTNSSPSEWKKGRMYVRKISSDKYTFVIYTGKAKSADPENEGNSMVWIKTRKGYTIDDSIYDVKVSKDEIFDFVSLNSVVQKYRPGEKLGEEFALETYIM